jgi:hypothetical protein
LPCPPGASCYSCGGGGGGAAAAATDRLTDVNLHCLCAKHMHIMHQI